MVFINKLNDLGYDGLSQGMLREPKSVLLSARRIIDHLDILQQAQQNIAPLPSAE